MLSASPEIVDFGPIRQGSRRFDRVEITNPGTEAVVVTRIRTDCPCLTVKLEAAEVPPKGKTTARVDLDMRHELDFTGNLASPVEGWTASGQMALSFRVDVAVHPRAAAKGGAGRE